MRPLRECLIVAGALLGLAGCSFIPTYERPPAPVAATFPQDGAASGTAAADLAWGDFIDDPRTRALVDIALRENRDLRVAVLAVEQARAVLGVQRADELPSIGVGVAADRSSTASLYRAGLVLSPFEIDLFGRVRSLSEAAAARALASEEARRAVQLGLVTAVASAELALRADDELIAVTGQVLASREEALRLTRLKFDAGAAGEPELRSIESLAAGARAGLIALQRQRQQNLNVLVLLLGRPLPDDLPPPRPLEQQRLPDLPAGVPSQVLLQRPDVLAAEQQLIAANANIGAARAAFFPRITLTGSAGFASTDLSGLFDNTGWTFVPQLLQPIFDAGRNEATLAATEAARSIALAQYEKAIQTAFREVADALAGRATLGAQREAQQAQAEAESRRAAQVQRLFDAGAASAFERQDADRNQLLARLAVVQVQLAERQNALQLYRSLGGGVRAASPP
jgi:NodT family efflux transporter outer membrane factor (OMF) lipoprotein